MAPRQDERMIAIPLRAPEEGALEGIFQSGGPGAGPCGSVIAPPHPLYGGSMDSPVVNEIAWASARAGIAAVRFNWRGVGASSGVASGDTRDADADYAAALAHVAATVPGKVVACGYSFGAAAALRAAQVHPRIGRVLLVAPPASLIERGALRALERPTLVLTGSDDRLAPAATLGAELEEAPQARLEVVKGADHFFVSGLAELSRLAQSWLAITNERGA
jgi:alpha/beta superfamily hydrolase